MRLFVVSHGKNFAATTPAAAGRQSESYGRRALALAGAGGLGRMSRLWGFNVL